MRENERSYPGLNFFSAQDQTLIETLARGEFNLRGLQNKNLRARLGKQVIASGLKLKNMVLIPQLALGAAR